MVLAVGLGLTTTRECIATEADKLSSVTGVSAYRTLGLQVCGHARLVRGLLFTNLNVVTFCTEF